MMFRQFLISFSSPSLSALAPCAMTLPVLALMIVHLLEMAGAFRVLDSRRLISRLMLGVARRVEVGVWGWKGSGGG